MSGAAFLDKTEASLEEVFQWFSLPLVLPPSSPVTILQAECSFQKIISYAHIITSSAKKKQQHPNSSGTQILAKPTFHCKNFPTALSGMIMGNTKQHLCFGPMELH